MKSKTLRRVISLVAAFCFVFQQASFAQDFIQLNGSGFLNVSSALGKYRPAHLRYFSYNPLTDIFQILIDKGDLKETETSQIETQGQELLKYFLIGVALPDDNFWVNLRPDIKDKIISADLAKTDIGKVLLEVDLQLKKDLAKSTSPETSEGKAYWNKLYEKANEIFGAESATISTLTRPWIVPGEVIIRETANSAYIYKATLKVMLEQDHLKNSPDYNFSDPRVKALNAYSSQLIRDNIIPKLTKEVNSAARYAPLRQVFYSLILSRWFKQAFAGKNGLYASLINSSNLSGLTSLQPWSKATYFKEYRKSFANGEYNIQEQVNGMSGVMVRNYVSGGVALDRTLEMPRNSAASPLGTFIGRSSAIARALGNRLSAFFGTPSAQQMLPNLEPTMWTEGFASPTGVKFAHDKILKPRIEQAFKDGRVIELLKADTDNGRFAVQALRNDDFVISLARKIVNTKPGEKGAGLHARVQQLLSAYEATREQLERERIIAQLRELLINQTRFIALVFGEGGTDPYLFNIGDITSEEHRAIVEHAGTFAYEGSAGVAGGPRTIYLTSARINGYRNLGNAGVEAFQELIAHGLTDLVAGKHVNESLPKLTAANLQIGKMYRDEVVRVIQGTKRGVATYDTGKVSMEKYTITGDLGQQEVFALKGSSKTHPDVPKGSRKLNLMVVKADVGSIGGHGSVPSAMLEAVADFWAQAAAEGKIIDFFVTRCGDDISITVTHINGKDNPMMHKLAWDAFINATVVAKDLSLYGAGQDLLADSFSGNIRGAGPGVAEMEFIERTSEPIMVLAGDKWAPGGFSQAINWIYADPNSPFFGLKPQQANEVQFGIIDFEANGKRGRFAILDPRKMQGFQISQALKAIAADQTRYSFTNLTSNGQDIAAVTASRLHNIAGEYTGKDDPMAVFRTQNSYPAEGILTAPFFTGEYKVFGWMMGSHKGYLLPVSLPEAKIGVFDGPPLLTAFGFNINNGRLVGFMDLMAANPAVRAVQDMVGKKTAALLGSSNFFNQVEGAAPAVELAYQKGLMTTLEKNIPWRDFDSPGSASSPASSSSPFKDDVQGTLGGIDFRVITAITQPMGNLFGLSFSLPKLSNIENVNLDEEFSQIQKMLWAGIVPSGARLKEYIAACYQKGELKTQLDGIIATLIDTCKLQEETVTQASNEMKEALLILDSAG